MQTQTDAHAKTHKLKWISLLTAVVIAGAGLGIQSAPLRRALAAPDAPLDVPDTLVAGGVNDYTVAAPKVFWRSRDCTPKPPALANAADESSAPEAAPAPIVPQSPESPDAASLTDSESISRVAVQGSPTRVLYSASASGYCGALAHVANSNIVADADYLYWVTDQGLVRLSTNANPGDAPQVFTPGITSYYPAELAIDSDNVYVLTTTNSPSSTIRKISKANGAPTTLRNIGQLARNLQVSHAFSFIGQYSGDYVYWIDGGVLRRLNLNTNALDNVASGVIQYYAEGGRTFCSGQFGCTTTDLVFLTTGRYLFTANNKSLGSVTQIHDTGDPNDTIYDIVTGGDHVFFLQEHFVPCAPQPCFGGAYTDYVYRRGRSAGGNTDLLATSRIEYLTPYSVFRNLTTANGYLMWQTDGKILRLPNNAAALPLTNMKITGLLITQGIQRPDNSVLLIEGRRTFVRVFVKSDGPKVSGVTARLERLDSNNNPIDSVLPANSVGTNITVWPSPVRANLNDGFLFELPWSWITSGLRLRVRLNPYHAPPENFYGDNDSSLGPLTFNASAALKVNFVAWGYVLNNQSWYPRYIKDLIQTFSWIQRAYPLASKITFDGATGNQPGLHPNLWFVGDDTLGSLVNQTNLSCQDLLIKNPDGTTKNDFRNLCASRYTNNQMGAMRKDNDLPESRFFYGFISDAAGFFPRGQACCKPNVSTGPAGSGTWGWDNDGSYADWYAAHEIGHTLGRGHPDLKVSKTTATNNGCNLYDGETNGGDTNYPWQLARIGQTDETEGFDAGDPSLGIPRAVYQGTVWRDVMSYCNNQWVGDYTYKGMYDYMKANPSLSAMMTPQAEAPAEAQMTPQSAEAGEVSGDFLDLQGTIIAEGNTASFQRVRRVNSATIPPLTPGPYAIRLFDAGNTLLADYPFMPETGDETPGVLHFDQVVNFVNGTRIVRIVRIGDGQVLATANISPNAPVVSNVALQGAPNPVTGTVTLTWSASDADNDALRFNVLYSRNGGASFQTVKTGVTGNSTAIDTSTLGGSTGILRVIADDGANTGQADSAPFTLADKPPMPMIFTPGDGLRIHYGQLVNFSGAAMDWQDGGVTGANLVWSSNLDGPLGTGELISSQTLKVGSHIITLKATNSKGMMATTSITVIVDDDLNLLGPTLTAAPAQFSFSFAAGATAPAAQVVAIGNAGSGDLNWTASVDAPWLSLSASSGAAPASVTLTADPASIPDGSALSATLTLVAPAQGGQPAQTLTIPVNLGKGLSLYTAMGSGGPTQRTVYLPLVLR